MKKYRALKLKPTGIVMTDKFFKNTNTVWKYPYLYKNILKTKECSCPTNTTPGSIPSSGQKEY